MTSKLSFHAFLVVLWFYLFFLTSILFNYTFYSNYSRFLNTQCLFQHFTGNFLSLCADFKFLISFYAVQNIFFFFSYLRACMLLIKKIAFYIKNYWRFSRSLALYSIFGKNGGSFSQHLLSHEEFASDFLKYFYFYNPFSFDHSLLPQLWLSIYFFTGFRLNFVILRYTLL